jgi:hypothetical protein
MLDKNGLVSGILYLVSLIVWEKTNLPDSLSMLSEAM